MPLLMQEEPLPAVQVDFSRWYAEWSVRGSRDCPACVYLPPSPRQVVWAMSTVQVVSQVARVTSPSLPPLMAALYRAVAVLQVRTSGMHGRVSGAPKWM